jgi:hypothetical protein
MAIQLNDRDHLIFKMIDEHQVLLEKHISWFIAGEDKPVLIRDRLRKLFYLDYLLCQRHGTKLPWWTTPTKPLVYMLAPMSKQVAEMADSQLDLFDSGVQRHLLEVANIRMLCMIAKKDADLEDFDWVTLTPSLSAASNFDAILSVKAKALQRKIGIINHPADKDKFLAGAAKAIEENQIQNILVVSRDEAHQKDLQELVAKNMRLSEARRLLFVTHHELYRSGIAKACMQTEDRQTINVFGEACVPASNSVSITTGFAGTPAISM